MKTNYLILIFFSLFGLLSYSQTISRVEINGKIIVDRNDVEGVAVFNISSGQGTVTNNKGEFIIKVAINDQIEFAALQFNDFKVFITQEVINNKEITVLLVEQINKLNEVLILPHNLSGNLIVDSETIKLINPNLNALYFGLGNLDKIDFTFDYLSEVQNNAISENQIIYGMNVIEVIDLFAKALFKPKDLEPFVPDYKRPTILNTYSEEFLLSELIIKEVDIIEFVYFVEENSFDFSLLQPKREIEFLNFINLKQQEFISVKYDRK